MGPTPTFRLFDDGRCVIHCPTGRYADGKQCQPCHPTCHACTDEGAQKCTSCDKDRFGVTRYLFQNECLDVCPEGFHQSARMRCEPSTYNFTAVRLEPSCGDVSDADCLSCDEGCKKCKQKDPEDQKQKSVCIKCEEGFYQLDADCHQSCPDGTYGVEDTMVCSPCEDKHCAVCDDSQCYWCGSGYYVSDGECVDHCEDGFFVDAKGRECEPCHSNCQTCGGPQHDDCDSCKDGFTLMKGECIKGRQLVVCSEKQFRNSQDTCESCHSSCKTCSGEGKENCSSCLPGRFLTPHQTCLSLCPSGTFGNKTSGQCEECLTGCIMCQEAQVCQGCHEGLYLQDGVCVKECQRGFPQGELCHPCAPKCGSCEESPSRCLSCDRPLLLLDHDCVSSCPKGFYTNSTECHRCPDHCSECNQDGLCGQCKSQYFLHEDECVDDCPKGYFPSIQQHECVRCHADCATCDGPGIDDCNECRNPKAVRYSGECLPSCPSNTYYDKSINECKGCDESCLTCSGHEPFDCLSCDANRRKDATGHCAWSSECPVGSYVDQNGECHQCHSLCRQCHGPGKDHCLSCSEHHFLLNNTCVETCPVGYYVEGKGEGVCQFCYFSCESCVGRHSEQCVTCRPEFFKHGSSCVKTCPDSHFGNMSSMVCERCDPSCSKCSGSGNTKCLSCRQDYRYMKHWGQCLKSCPPGYYKDKWSANCLTCDPTCKTCSDGAALTCLSCYDNFIFKAGYCQNPCFIGFYPSSEDSQSEQESCRACDPSCEGCRGPSMWHCTVCPPSQILSDDGRCLSCCGPEMLYNNKPIPRECCDCKASREECIMGVNFVMITDNGLGSTPKVVATACVLLILLLGVAIFLFLSARLKLRSVRPKTKAGGYEKLNSTEDLPPQSTTSFGEYSDKLVGGEDNDEECDDEDIVYMTKEGTVYRKFKYGLLDDDDDELEYDDESYSFR
ncbi:proprotein convertase subtilisin/kexin type 5 [Kryptolebias marmoratus]|uniref:proprotein convertase subtilisin/kexin type 5 n=1 Tax=Kryptolebias marmoratus TaxID=37003 RepID=UPI000D52F3FA|nr:proprotein convertase subtilisin/kexin type 5 [Kryptolebias marmoratus]